MEVLNYNDFMSNKTNIVHNDDVHDGEIKKTSRTLELMVINNSDVATHNTKKVIKMCDVDVLMRDSEGNYFFEYTFIRDSDIIDNISFESTKNATFSYNIGGVFFDSSSVTEILSLSCYGVSVILRVTFTDKPNHDDTVTISYRDVFISESKERKKMMDSNITIVTNSLSYNGGYAKPTNK